jgi:nitrite reductase (NADH) small subunit
VPDLHKLGNLTQIPEGQGRNFEVSGLRIAVFRQRDGRVFATQADCPHRGGPLADGLVGGETLVCPLHEWRFNLATGDSENGSCGIQTYRITLDGEGTMLLEVP